MKTVKRSVVLQMVLTAGGADGANCCSRNLWIFGIGDPLNTGIGMQ